MKFTKQEIFKVEVLVLEKIDELQEILDIFQRAGLSPGEWIEESIKEYKEIEKKLDVLYK